MKKIINHPISRIILGVIISLGIPMLINKPILKNLFKLIGLNDTINGLIRVSFASVILMPVLYIWFYKKVEKRRITEWSFDKFFKESMLGLILSVASISFLVFLCSIFVDIDINFSGITGQLIPGVLLIFSLVLIEEIAFRGILYRILEEKLGMNWALLISGVLFGLAHITNDNITFQSLLGVISGGLLMGALFSYRRRMWLPIFAHYGWNLAQVLFGINLSGTDKFSDIAIFKTTLNGPVAITGGEFGIENSIFAIIFVTIVFVVFYRLTKRELPTEANDT